MQTSAEYKTYKFIVRSITRLYDCALLLKEIYPKVHHQGPNWDKIMDNLDACVDDYLSLGARTLPREMFAKLLNEQILDKIMCLIGL